MGCCISFSDNYQECEFLIEEFKLIILQESLNKFTENEQKALYKFKNEKQEKIRILINELEKDSIDEIQRRKVLKLGNEFNEILKGIENSESSDLKE